MQIGKKVLALTVNSLNQDTVVCEPGTTSLHSELITQLKALKATGVSTIFLLHSTNDDKMTVDRYGRILAESGYECIGVQFSNNDELAPTLVQAMKTHLCDLENSYFYDRDEENVALLENFGMSAFFIEEGGTLSTSLEALMIVLNINEESISDNAPPAPTRSLFPQSISASDTPPLLSSNFFSGGMPQSVASALPLVRGSSVNWRDLPPPEGFNADGSRKAEQPHRLEEGSNLLCSEPSLNEADQSHLSADEGSSLTPKLDENEQFKQLQQDIKNRFNQAGGFSIFPSLWKPKHLDALCNCRQEDIQKVAREAYQDAPSFGTRLLQLDKLYMIIGYNRWSTVKELKEQLKAAGVFEGSAVQQNADSSASAPHFL